MATLKTNHALHLLASIEMLRRKCCICDFIIHVGTETFHVHRTVLAACSAYFCAMLSHDTKEAKEGQVVIHDMDHKALKKCLHYMYTGEITVTMDNVESLLYASNLMQLDEIANQCYMFLDENLSVDHCLNIYQLLQIYTNPELMEKTVRFVRNNVDDVITTERFSALSVSDVMFFIAESCHKAWWKAVTTWVGFNPEEKELYLTRFLKTAEVQKFPLNFVLLTMLPQLHSQAHSAVLLSRIFSDVERLLEEVDYDNCVSIRKLADESNNWKVINFLDSFMVENFQRINEKGYFKSLDHQTFKKALTLYEPGYFHEKQKWDALINWTRHDNRRKTHFYKLLKSIKLHRMDVEFLKNDVRNEPLVKKSAKCRCLLLDAICDGNRSSEWISILNREELTIDGFNLSRHEKCPLAKVKPATFMKIVSFKKRLYLLLDAALQRLAEDGTWEPLAPMSRNPPDTAALVALHDFICVVDIAMLSFYHPEKNKWTKVAHNNELSHPILCAASKKHLYVVEEEKIQCYDTKSKTWSDLPPRIGCWDPGAVVFQGHALYLFGGHWGGMHDRRVAMYDTVTEQWDEVPNMQVVHKSFTVCATDDVLYAVGGACYADGKTRRSPDCIEIHDVQLRSWMIVQNFCTTEDSIASYGISACLIDLPCK